MRINHSFLERANDLARAHLRVWAIIWHVCVCKERVWANPHPTKKKHTLGLSLIIDCPPPHRLIYINLYEAHIRARELPKCHQRHEKYASEKFSHVAPDTAPYPPASIAFKSTHLAHSCVCAACEPQKRSSCVNIVFFCKFARGFLLYIFNFTYSYKRICTSVHVRGTTTNTHIHTHTVQ